MTEQPQRCTAKNWAELVKHLPVSRKTLDKYRRMNGTPKSLNVEEWQEFCANVKAGILSADGQLPDMAELLHRKTAAETRIKEAEAAIRENERRVQDGELVEVATVRQESIRAGVILQQSLMSMGPGIAVEAQAMLKNAQDVDVLAGFITEKVRAALTACVERLKAEDKGGAK